MKKESKMNLDKTRGTWIPPLSQKPVILNTTGYYDILRRANPDPVEEPPRATIVDKKITRVRQVRIYPDDNQRILLRKWLLHFAEMYNYTNTYIKDLMMVHDCPGAPRADINKFLNWQNIRQTLRDQRDLCKQDNIPTHILDAAIQQCVAAYKTCCANYFAGRIWHFDVRDWFPNKTKQIMRIEGSFFSKTKNGFCVSSLGIMRSDEDLTDIRSTTTLVFDRERRSWTLMVPEELVGKQAKGATAKRQCGIDPGARTAFTVYSPNRTYDIHPKVDFPKVFRKQDRLRKHYKKGKMSYRQFHKAMRKRNRKMQNRITDMHWKVGKFLCEKFDRIVIGRLNIQSAISNKNTSQLGSYTKRTLAALSHYKFRQRLKEQGEKYGAIVIDTSEYKTTVTCSECHHEQNVGKSKVYNCGGCGIIMDRDCNSARNMYGKE